MINETILQEKRNNRVRKINDYAAAKKIPTVQAAIFIDFNAPKTTNLKMLNEVGYNLTEVTEDNCMEVIAALDAIGIVVLGYEEINSDRLVTVMNTVINEEVNECWGGPDMQEFVEVN
jgi:hypothetical protein